jgi:hypothetical protein
MLLHRTWKSPCWIQNFGLRWHVDRTLYSPLSPKFYTAMLVRHQQSKQIDWCAYERKGTFIYTDQRLSDQFVIDDQFTQFSTTQVFRQRQFAFTSGILNHKRRTLLYCMALKHSFFLK